jgi:hypothetical protein
MTSRQKNIVINTLNKYHNCGIDHTLSSDDHNIAEFTDKYCRTLMLEDIVPIVHKCLSEKEMKHIILRHELKFLKIQSKDMTLDQFKKEVVCVLKRYQHCAGGFNMDDSEWIIHDKTSKNYTVYETELIFENTLHMDYKTDVECSEYMELLINRLNMIALNIVVSIHTYLSERDQIYYILLKCKDNSAMICDIEISKLLDNANTQL